MKKVYYCLFAICSFFIFSFGLSANTQLFIDSSENVFFGGSCNNYKLTDFLGYKIYSNNCTTVNKSAYFNVYKDYYNVIINNDSDYRNYSSLLYLFNSSLNLYSNLVALLPSASVVKPYYTISYVYSTYDNYVSLYLIFYDSPIVYNDIDGIKDFRLKNGNSSDSTFVYKFKVTDNSFVFVDYSTTTYSDILNNSVVFTGDSRVDSSLISSSSDGYYVNSSFYNFFFDSNFVINFNHANGDNSINPNYIVNRVKKNSGFDILRDNVFSSYKLDYFKTYVFSGGTTGIQSFSNVVNYKQKLKPPFNGGYGTFTFSYFHRKNILKYVGDSDSSVIYFQGGMIISYLENDKLSLKKSTFAVNCDREQNDLCSFKLDFSNLENPSAILYYESNILSETYNFYYSSYPSVWYKLKDFKWYSMNNEDADNLFCYNCDLDDDGNYPFIKLPNSELNLFLDSIDIDYTNNTSSMSSLFSSSFRSIKVIVDSSIEILSLVANFFYSLPLLLQSFLLVLFLISMIYIFIRFIR